MIALNNIEHSYPNGANRRVPVISDLSFELADGESCALTGPSGSGKSTLINIMALLLRPEKGRYEFCGKDVTRLTPSRRAALRLNNIGCIVQDYALLSDQSALDNVMTPLMIRGGMKKADMIACAMERLNEVGMEDLAGRSVGKLSGGQRQRVAIARALITDPRLILADEPTAQLDAHTARRVTDLLIDITQGNTSLVFATHDMALAREFNKRIDMCQ